MRFTGRSGIITTSEPEGPETPPTPLGQISNSQPEGVHPLLYEYLKVFQSDGLVDSGQSSTPAFSSASTILSSDMSEKSGFCDPMVACGPSPFTNGFDPSTNTATMDISQAPTGEQLFQLDWSSILPLSNSIPPVTPIASQQPDIQSQLPSYQTEPYDFSSSLMEEIRWDTENNVNFSGQVLHHFWPGLASKEDFTLGPNGPTSYWAYVKTT